MMMMIDFLFFTTGPSFVLGDDDPQQSRAEGQARQSHLGQEMQHPLLRQLTSWCFGFPSKQILGCNCIKLDLNEFFPFKSCHSFL